MGNQFAIQGLGDEATHGRRDDKARRTGSGWRPSDPELADERILTNTPKPSKDINVLQISARTLCTTGVFQVGLLNDDRKILLRPTPVAMATKFGTKSAITRLIIRDIRDIFVYNRGFSGSCY